MNSTETSSGPSERVAALASLYQAERQDAASILLTSLALIAGGLTYLGVTAVLINNSSLPGGSWVSAFLAFPLWIIASYHVLLVGTALVRSASIEVVEQQLTQIIGFDKTTKEHIGSRAGQKILNLDEQPFALRSQSIVSYGGMGVIIVIFTGFCLTVAAKSEGWVSPPVFCAGIIYLLLLASTLLAWRHVLNLSQVIPKAARDS